MKRTYELTIEYQGEEILLIASDRLGTDLEVFMYVGDISKEDYLKVENPLPFVLAKFQNDFQAAHGEVESA